MRNFSNKITLTKNSRGVYDLDTSKGCSSGMSLNEKGCYSECYACRYSIKYGYDFSKTVLRYFKDENHKNNIIKKINKIDMDFIRMGVTGDPSENWEHLLSICESIKPINKKIVIITKHWNNLNESQLERVSKLNLCINTSISALDTHNQIHDRLKQYNILKKYCLSVLRIVSCKFNLENEIGLQKHKIQEQLFNNDNVLDTVFRVYKKNEHVLNGTININETKFLGKKCNVSLHNENTYFGSCLCCLDKCGLIYGKKPV